MSKNKVTLCKHILMEHYGDSVASVGAVLLNKGPTPLGLIVQQTDSEIKAKQVKKCLSILIHQNLCTFERSSKGQIEYNMLPDTVMSCLRYPRYIYCAKVQHDAASELIIEELLQQGRSLLSDIVAKVMERLNEALESQGSPKVEADFVIEKFSTLVKHQFVQRCIQPERDKNNRVTSVPVNSEIQFNLPTPEERERGKRKRTGDHSEQPRKKRKVSQDESDAPVYWRVNNARFYLHLRDRAFITAISRRVDAKAGEVVATMLRVSALRTNMYAQVTTPISVHEIKSGLPKDYNMTKTLLDQYLKILVDDSSEIVCKVEESGGGMYSINILKGLQSLCRAHTESMIQEKYGSKSLRIYRMLLTKRHVEQKQELCKTPDHAPARTTFLFTVDETHVTRMLMEKCYKGLCNSIIRRHHELKENKRLVDKQQRVEAIVASLGGVEGNEEQKAELEELISPSERAHITKVTADIKRLEQCELQIDSSLLVLSQYLDYQAVSKKDSKTK